MVAGTGKLNTVVVWIILLCLVLAGPVLSNTIWLHASGYYRHAISNPNSFLGETMAVNQFLDMLGMAFCGILFVASFVIWKRRAKSRDSYGTEA